MATLKLPRKNTGMAANIPLPIDDSEEINEPMLYGEEDDESSESQESGQKLIEQDDGSAIIMDEEAEDKGGSSDFYINLADSLPSDLLRKISSNLLESIERDKRSREQRDKQYAEGIKRTGLGNEAPGGATFDGASRAVHPVLVEACIDFQARAMKEIMPAKGPVKIQIIGKATEAKTDKAKRKKEYMNWQLTRQAREYRTELEQLLAQLPLGGSQYMKVWYDSMLGRPHFEFVSIDDIYLPFACTDFYTTPRLTHVQHLTRVEYESRVDAGIYIDVGEIGSDSMMPDTSKSSEATDKIEGREGDYNEDGLRDVYEIHVNLDLEDGDKLCKEGRTAPYVVSMGDTHGQVFSIYRNWDEEDDKKQKLHWIVEFQFIPWRGAYAIGLAQAIGSLAGAATGALRALLDAAHIQTMPTALKLKGARVSGQTLDLLPTGITEIEGPASVDDIRKLTMPLPFPGPSMVLFELMKFCADSAKNVVSVATEQIADSSPDMPVGTALAMIEQGSVTFSAVHARLHESQRRVLEILHRLNAEHLEDEETIEELGELIVRREDFIGPMDVVPVSDPNIFSDTQRYAQNQAVIQLRGMFPEAFKVPALVERTLQLLNYPDYEAVLNTPLAPEKLSAVEENVAARDPQSQLKVYSDQDDLSHLKVHIPFMTSPVLCASPLMGPIALPKLVQHCADHIIALYKRHAMAASEVAKVTGLADSSHDAEVQGVQLAEQEMVREISDLMPHIEESAKLAQTFSPQPPVDPTVQAAQIREQGATQREQDKAKSALESAQANIAATQQADMMRAKLEEQHTLLVAKIEQAAVQLAEASENARRSQEMDISARNTAIAEDSEQRKQEMAVMTAKMAEQMETARNTQDNQTSIIVEQMRHEAEANRASVDNLNKIIEAFTASMRNNSINK